jgi:hypothetical protein
MTNLDYSKFDDLALINRLEAFAFERGLDSNEVLKAEDELPSHRTERQRDKLDADKNNELHVDALKTELARRLQDPAQKLARSLGRN